jgi:hypothetical protein
MFKFKICSFSKNVKILGKIDFLKMFYLKNVQILEKFQSKKYSNFEKHYSKIKKCSNPKIVPIPKNVEIRKMFKSENCSNSEIVRIKKLKIKFFQFFENIFF